MIVDLYFQSFNHFFFLSDSFDFLNWGMFSRTGSLMNLPVQAAPPPPNRVSPPPPAASKSSTGLNHTCPSCGICFSSASTLSAHVTYYCSKRPQVTPAGSVAPVTNESPLPTLPAQSEMMSTPLSNGRSQTPEPVDEMVKHNFYF